MKLTTERLKKIIREELSKVINESDEDYENSRSRYFQRMGDSPEMAARYSDTESKIMTIDDPNGEWSIEVDTRQASGRQAKKGDYSHPSIQKLINKSISMGGKTARHGYPD